ncbi:hypothetical protein [Actinacidiphila oryziradicis]|nr:hypothetical protein [Actinacidiphila oryziradicis]
MGVGGWAGAWMVDLGFGAEVAAGWGAAGWGAEGDAAAAIVWA